MRVAAHATHDNNTMRPRPHAHSVCKHNTNTPRGEAPPQQPTTAQPSTNARGRAITRGGAACKHSPSDVIRSLAGRETSCGNEIQHGRAHDRDEPGPKHREYSETNSNISQNTAQTGANNVPEPAHGRAGPLTTAHGPPNDNGAARETEHRCPGQEYTATDIPAAPHTYTVPDFDAIRKVCETNDDTHSMDTHPRVFRDYRRHEWPTFSENTAPNDLVFIYNTVRETGLPNCMKARIELPSNLHLDKWAEYLGDAPEDTELLDFLRFGFPLGYMGPTSHVDGNVNHPSTTKYPEHVDQFIKKELSEGCMLGPYDDPVFTPWLHCSPLMTRPKRESTSRRVITDMTHPNHCSIIYSFKYCEVNLYTPNEAFYSFTSWLSLHQKNVRYHVLAFNQGNNPFIASLIIGSLIITN